MKRCIVVLMALLAGLGSRAFCASSGPGSPFASSTSGESVVNRVLRLDGQADYVRVEDSQAFHSLARDIS